jgi:mycothiol synthase
METPMKTDAAARAAGIPGLVIRPYAGEADIPEIVRVMNAELAFDGVRERATVEDAAATYRHASESFDATRDVLLAELDGTVVGYVRVDWIDASDGSREYRSRGAVVPAWRRRGIGRRLLHAGHDLIRMRAAEHETDRPRVIGMFSNESQAGRLALARSEGYTQVRWFFEMERAGLDSELPPLPPLPDGLELRPVTRDAAKAVWAADLDAFRDHWGGWDPSEASFRRWVESSQFQPDLFLVAWDGDEIAGAVLNAIYAEENEALGLRRGWLDSVFTRRAWRGRGLARVLITRSLHVLAARGMDTAALGVDADNPTGALGLYESCGFVVVDREIIWQKPLEAGP